MPLMSNVRQHGWCWSGCGSRCCSLSRPLRRATRPAAAGGRPAWLARRCAGVAQRSAALSSIGEYRCARMRAAVVGLSFTGRSGTVTPRRRMGKHQGEDQVQRWSHFIEQAVTVLARPVAARVRSLRGTNTDQQRVAAAALPFSVKPNPTVERTANGGARLLRFGTLGHAVVCRSPTR